MLCIPGKHDFWTLEPGKPPYLLALLAVKFPASVMHNVEVLQKQFLTEWKSRHFPLVLFLGKVYPTHSHSIRPRHIVALVCNWFESYWGRRPCHGSGVVSASWSSNWKERNCKYNERLLDFFPPTIFLCLHVCYFDFFLRGIHFSFAAIVLPYTAKQVVQRIRQDYAFVMKQQRQRKWS